MKNIFPTYAAALLTAIFTLSLVSCSSEIETVNETSEKTDAITMPLALKGIPYNNYEESSSPISSEVSLFHFKNDDFTFSNVVKDPHADGLEISVGSTSKIYCVSGLNLKASSGSTKEHDFALNTVAFDKKTNNAPLFYSSVVDVNSVWRYGRVEVALERSVSRIDFTNFVDADVYVSEVTVLDAPASTFVFSSGSMPSDETVSLSKTFSTPLQGSETGLFNIFESTRPVHVRISGKCGAAPLDIEAVIPSVVRNKVYSIQIERVNGKFQASYSVNDWVENLSVYAKTSASSSIDIDKENSILPSGVMVDYASNHVRVPASGVSGMRIAFVSSSKVSVTSIVGEMGASKVSGCESVKAAGGYLSYFNVDIEPQRNGASSYSMMVNLRDEEGNADFVEISVQSFRHIETVNIAGAEWMCFNAVSADIDNQVFPIEGISVEEMYRDHWVQSIGNFFQYGKQKSYNPWTRNDPNANNQTASNTPWTASESIPMPEGYHVATSAEWLSLLPTGTSIPSTYTAGNGEQLKVEIVELPGYVAGTPSSKANKANLEMRYIRFESLETGNVLILRVCGQKTADTDEVPGSMWKMSESVCYWTSDEACESIRISASDGTLKASQKLGRFDLNGFLPVRGVKNS